MKLDVLEIPISKVGKLLDYNGYTGDFYWKESRGRVSKGDIAGCSFENGDGNTYYKIVIERTSYLAHRLAWSLYHNTQIPSGCHIDHINGDGLDNRIVNLRLATNTQNAQNISSRRGKYSKLKGVSYHKNKGKFCAQIRVNGKSIWLGSFDDEDTAAKVYAEAAERYFGTFKNHD